MVNDFPKAELKPLDAIMQLQEKGVYHCYGYFDGDECSKHLPLASHYDNKNPVDGGVYFPLLPFWHLLSFQFPQKFPMCRAIIFFNMSVFF